MFDCKMENGDRANLSIPRNQQKAGSGKKQLLQSIMNLNCAAGGGRPQDFYAEVPRSMISAPDIGSGSDVTNLTPMTQQKQDINAGTEVDRQGSMNASPVEDQGKETTVESTIERTLSENKYHSIERTATAVTVGNDEETPMALIVQRAPVDQIDTVKSDDHLDQSCDEAEGLELILEELHFRH
jgi:hypothetical protein